MWWAGRQACEIYLDRSEGAVHWPGRGQTQRVYGQDIAGVLDALLDLLRPMKRRFVGTAYLSGRLCKPFVIPDVTGIRNVGELQLVADSLAPEATGMDGRLRVHLPKGMRQVREGGRTVCAVLREADWLVVKERLALKENRGLLTVSTCEAWWAACSQSPEAQAADVSAIAVHEPHALIMLHRDERQARAAALNAALHADTAEGLAIQTFAEWNVPAGQGRVLRWTEDGRWAPVAGSLSGSGGRQA